MTYCMTKICVYLFAPVVKNSKPGKWGNRG